MQTSLGFILFTGTMPMNLEPQTIKDINRAFDWQLKGGNRASEYQIGELFNNGEIKNTISKELIAPTRGCYTEKAFRNFISYLEQLALEN